MASGQAVATWNTYRNLDLGITGQVIKASPGEVSGWFIANNAVAARFVQLYNKATTPTQADTPQLTLQIPAGASANVLSEAGIDFTTGIAIRASTGVADND